MSVPKVAAVIGAGTMGPGMAAVLARAGSQVRLYDVSDEVLDRARGACELASQALDRMEAASAPGGSVAFEPDLGTALTGAGLVLETIPEKLDLKREVLAAMEGHLEPDAIIATNTSGIPVSSIASALKHPARFIGMHWSNPPHLVPMIEVVPGEQTAAGTTQNIVEIISRIRLRGDHREGGARLRREPDPLRHPARMPVAGGTRHRLGGGPGHLRQVGNRLQACGHRPDAPPRHGRP